MCTAKAAIRGRGWGDQAQLYKYNGNLLHLSAFSLLEVVACGMNCRGRKVFVCVQKLKICWRKFAVSTDGGSGAERYKKGLVTISALWTRFTSLA